MASIKKRNVSWVENVVPAGEDLSTPADPDLYDGIEPFLQGLECLDPISLQDKGMLRWAFHKKLEKDPSKATELADKLVQDLEKIQRADEKSCIIPLLLTLIYVIFQSVYLPMELCERAYAACKSLLKLPKPYCIVGLACVRHMQTERSKPGALYQRTVIAEQNLWSKFQEMVFVFADAAVFSGPLGDAVRSHLEAARFRQPAVSHMRAVLQHTLQAALGNCCHGNALARTLKEMGRSLLEHYFQEVVRAVEQNAEEVGDGHGDKASGYRDRLHGLYRQIMFGAHEGEQSLCDTPLPPLNIRYHLWQEDDELWVEVENWIQRRSLGEGSPNTRRATTVSRDSGIEGDLPEIEVPESSPGATKEDHQHQPQQQQQQQQGVEQQGGEHQAPPDRLFRKPVTRKRTVRSSSVADLNENALCQYTACVVVMGDDRTLGRLAKAYHTLRADEAKFFSLRTRVNLEIYYIPVTNQHTSTSAEKEGTPPVQSYLDLASHLGWVDPWYECNINSLAHWIPTLVESANARSSSDPNPFLLDVLSYYKRTAWQPIHFTIYSVKIYSSDLSKSLEQVFLTHLAVDFPEGRNTKVSVKKETTLQICGPVVSITYKKVCLSGRQMDAGTSVRTTAIVINAIPSNDTEDPDQLTLRFKETQPKTSTRSVIQSRYIKIKTVEGRTFTVCLDKDTRRTYEDVGSIEISPCMDPRSILNTHITEPNLSLMKEKGAEPSKHMTKGLSLPINTFSGIIHI